MAKTDIDNRAGKVFVHGEWWNAVADGLIPAGSRVQVEAMENLVIKSKKIRRIKWNQCFSQSAADRGRHRHFLYFELDQGAERI